MRVGFTGTRRGATAAQMASVRRLCVALDISEGHEGDCVGFDAQVHAMLSGGLLPPCLIHVHPPLDTRHRAGRVRPGNVVHRSLPYLVRNRVIVESTDVLIAAPREADRPSTLQGQGTWWTVDCAEKRESPVLVVRPDGTVDVSRMFGLRRVLLDALALLSCRAKGRGETAGDGCR